MCYSRWGWRDRGGREKSAAYLIHNLFIAFIFSLSRCCFSLVFFTNIASTLVSSPALLWIPLILPLGFSFVVLLNPYPTHFLSFSLRWSFILIRPFFCFC